MPVIGRIKKVGGRIPGAIRFSDPLQPGLQSQWHTIRQFPSCDAEKQIKANLALFGRRELKEAIMRPSETINGLLYFPMTPESGTDAINIPVIDVENAVR